MEGLDCWMNWTVRYRSQTGAIHDEIVAGDNRAAVVSEMRKRGITPISISEGAKTSARPSVSPGSSKRLIVSVLIFSILTILILLICLVVGSRREQEKPQTPPRQQKIQRPRDTPPRATPAPTNTIPSAAVIPSPKLPEPTHSPTDIVKVISVVTNSNGSVMERYLRADGKTIRSIKPPPQIFRHGSDDILAMIASTPPGQEMPPLPPGAMTDSQFLASLEDPIEISDQDSDRVRLLKQSVISLRQQVKELLDAGQTVSQILAEHQKLQRDNAEVRTQALLEMRKILESGDRKEAIRYARTINVALGQMGVDAIPVPSENEGDVDPRVLRHRNKEASK